MSRPAPNVTLDYKQKLVVSSVAGELPFHRVLWNW